jgi:hypothetical protein
MLPAMPSKNRAVIAVVVVAVLAIAARNSLLFAAPRWLGRSMRQAPPE